MDPQRSEDGETEKLSGAKAAVFWSSLRFHGVLEMARHVSWIERSQPLKRKLDVGRNPGDVESLPP
jgi:hypothetical protein